GGHAADGVVAIVGAPDRVIRTDMHAVRAVEQALAPGTEEVARPIEHRHRVFAAGEDVDVVLAVDADGGDLPVMPSGGQRAPVLGHFVAVFAFTDDDGHGGFPSLLVGT